VNSIGAIFLMPQLTVYECNLQTKVAVAHNARKSLFKNCRKTQFFPKGIGTLAANSSACFKRVGLKAPAESRMG
jgi:hypothetical protein